MDQDDYHHLKRLEVFTVHWELEGGGPDLWGVTNAVGIVDHTRQWP